jgi:hypothetical protein
MVWVPAPVFCCGVLALFLTKRNKHSNYDISKWPHDTSTSIHKATKIKLYQNLNRLPAKPWLFDHSHIYVAERLPKSALDWIRCSISNSLIRHNLPFRSTFITLILSLPTPPILHYKDTAWSHGHVPHHSTCSTQCAAKLHRQQSDEIMGKSLFTILSHISQPTVQKVAENCAYLAPVWVKM